MNNIDNEITKIYDEIIKFFYNYNFHNKIDLYTTSLIFDGESSDMLIMREQVLQLIRDNSHLQIKEIDHNKKPEKFYAIKVNNDATLKLFLIYCIFYYLDNRHSYKKLYVGLDFEFNQNKIALCQFGFFPDRKFKYIFVIDPKMLNDKQLDIIIKTIFISDVYRIVHGADSLDIPYIFEELFMNDTEKIIKFTQTMVDTRYLCEYYKIFSKHPDKKCSLYDALLYFNVIKKSQYEDLNKINSIMGPIQDVQWNIDKMSSFHLKYVIYDVLYAKKFIKNIFIKASQKNTSLHQQLKLIPTIDRFHYYEKYGISNVLSLSKDVTDNINNYWAESKDYITKKTLISVYTNVINKLVIPSTNTKISNLLEINNFKKTLSLLFKRIIYSIITEKYDVYTNKKDRFVDKISWKELLKNLLDLKLDKLASFLVKFHDASKASIISEL